MPVKPWGIPIGNYLRDVERIPVILPTSKVGFCLQYLVSDAVEAFKFLESVSLTLLEQLSVGRLHIHLFDDKHIEHFSSLNQLKEFGIVHTAINAEGVEGIWSEMEMLIEFSQISEWPCQLLLINGDVYPDERMDLVRMRNLYQSASDSGVYMIVYTTKGNLAGFDSRNWLLGQLPIVQLKAGNWHIPQSTFAFTQLSQYLPFEIIDPERDAILKQLHQKFKDATLAEAQEAERIASEQASVLQATAQQNPESVPSATVQADDGDGVETQEVVSTEASAVDQETLPAESDVYLDVVVGKKKDDLGNKPLHLQFNANQPNHHNVLLTGSAATGKTTLLNNIIIKIGERYTSQQIRLYLVDFKISAEFKAFENHPNVEKIYLTKGSAYTGEKILMELIALVEKRRKLFAKAQVAGIKEYNQVHPHKPLPRVVVIIDECKDVFSDDFRQATRLNNHFSELMRDSYQTGMHLIVATQNLGYVPLSENVIALMGVRMSFKSFDGRGRVKLLPADNADVIMDLERYQFLYNDDSGHASANQMAMANSPPVIYEAIDEIREQRNAKLCLTPEII